jgi:hypothetical protein
MCDRIRKITGLPMSLAINPISAFPAPVRAMLCLGLLMLSMPAHSSEGTGEPLIVDDRLVLELAGIKEAQLADLRAGKVVILKPGDDDVIDVNEFNLYSGYAVIIKASTEAVVKVLARPEWAGAGIPGALALFIENGAAFPPVAFGDGDSDEIDRILAGEDEVNLSNAELRALNELGLTSDYDSNELKRFNAKYREILRARYETYLKSGLDGISPYEDGRDSFSLAEHFRLVNGYWNAWLPKVLPEYENELSLAPGKIDPSVEQVYLLVRKTIGDRPIYSLVHRFGRVSGDLIAAVHREFFVSGAFGGMQLVFIGISYEGGTLLIMGSDAFTEQVTGFGSGMKHNVGRNMMNDIMRGMLLELRAQAELLALAN